MRNFVCFVFVAIQVLTTSSFPQNLNIEPSTTPASILEDSILSINEYNFEGIESVINAQNLSNLTGHELENYNDIIQHKILGRSDMEPEATMTIEEIINYHGYPVTTFIVTTDDGYILKIQRIRYGVDGPGKERRKPVLIQHGLFCSAASWVTNNKEQNFPYMLADAGYDVWLGNFRGTSYGRNHTTISPNDKKFWRYSFDEMGKYDLPKIIDTILEETGNKDLLYVAHSMGTSAVFALLSTKPEYNKKIKGVLALGPAVFLGNVRSPIKYLVPFTNQIHWILDFVGKGELLPNSPLIKAMASTVCVSPVRILCSSVIFITCGFNLAQLNLTRLPVILHHTPDATSNQNFVHLAQMVATGKFQFQDYGPDENQKIYGQMEVPQYNLSKVEAPVAVFYGDGDLLADRSGISKLAQNLPNIIYKHRVDDPKFSHTDFMWAIDGKELLFDKVMEIMEKMLKI